LTVSQQNWCSENWFFAKAMVI